MLEVVPAGTLHGGKSQAVRTRTLVQFKKQENAVLVATDVAARGIHVDDVDLVVHFDAPADHKDYLHRSGRTARAGRTGRVVVLTTQKDRKAVSGITSRAGIEPKVLTISSMDENLVKITGAKKPSGIPMVQKETVVVKKQTGRTQRQSRGQGSRGRSSAGRNSARRKSNRHQSLRKGNR
ncbi:MAG: DEAD/DEAH box helicase [Actinobacteria bacterium]|nr:DEAD/DEAH box helicase [Actinomycetota bacterium]